MQLIPVLDILNGVVVRGMAGRRDEYRPIQSCLTDSVEALDVARAIRSAYGMDSFYVADLDAILSGRPNEGVYRDLIADGMTLSVDAGVATGSQVRALLQLGVAQAIVGLESCPSPTALHDIVAEVPRERIVFSVDLKEGIPLASPAWMSDPEEIAAQVIRCGVTRLIVLDLAGVGTGEGVPTISLCRRLRATYGSAIEITTGGGVRGSEDLELLEQAGVDGVLVASILHRPGFRNDYSGIVVPRGI